MIHKIDWKDRKNVISCYLPEVSTPDKNAVAELYQMTALEETSGWQRQAIFKERSHGSRGSS